jgi:hypothetical protein
MRTASIDRLKHYFNNIGRYPVLTDKEKHELSNILLNKDSLTTYEAIYAFTYFKGDHPREENHINHLKYYHNHVVLKKPVRLDDDPGDLIDEETKLDYKMAFSEIEYTFKNPNKTSPDDLYWQKVNDALIKNGHKGITIPKRSY